MGRGTFYLNIAQASAFVSFHLYFFALSSNNISVGGNAEVITISAFVLLSYNVVFAFVFKEARVKGKILVYAVFSIITMATFANGIVWPLVRDEGYSVDPMLFTHRIRTFKSHKRITPMALTIYGISMGFASFSMLSLILTGF